MEINKIIMKEYPNYLPKMEKVVPFPHRTADKLMNWILGDTKPVKRKSYINTKPADKIF